MLFFFFSFLNHQHCKFTLVCESHLGSPELYILIIINIPQLEITLRDAYAKNKMSCIASAEPKVVKCSKHSSLSVALQTNWFGT